MGTAASSDGNASDPPGGFEANAVDPRVHELERALAWARADADASSRALRQQLVLVAKLRQELAVLKHTVDRSGKPVPASAPDARHVRLARRFGRFAPAPFKDFLKRYAVRRSEPGD